MLVYGRTLLSVAILTIHAVAFADLRIEKDFRYPIRRSVLFNPLDIGNPCEPREFKVLHRRDGEGKPYDIQVTPVGEAESALIPLVLESFKRWRFSVPAKQEWATEFLSKTHENLFWTIPPCSCDIPRDNPQDSFREQICEKR
jgi:hypothetical protein